MRRRRRTMKSYPPRYYGTPDMLHTIEQIERLEDWLGDRKKIFENDFKEKEKRKKEERRLSWPTVVRTAVFLMVFGPWIVLLQYAAMKVVLTKLLN
jgi:hypothetical protein